MLVTERSSDGTCLKRDQMGTSQWIRWVKCSKSGAKRNPKRLCHDRRPLSCCPDGQEERFSRRLSLPVLSHSPCGAANRFVDGLCGRFLNSNLLLSPAASHPALEIELRSLLTCHVTKRNKLVSWRQLIPNEPSRRSGMLFCHAFNPSCHYRFVVPALPADGSFIGRPQRDHHH